MKYIKPKKCDVFELYFPSCQGMTDSFPNCMHSNGCSNMLKANTFSYIKLNFSFV